MLSAISRFSKIDKIVLVLIETYWICVSWYHLIGYTCPATQFNPAIGCYILRVTWDDKSDSFYV